MKSFDSRKEYGQVIGVSPGTKQKEVQELLSELIAKNIPKKFRSRVKIIHKTSVDNLSDPLNIYGDSFIWMYYPKGEVARAIS